MRATVDGLWKKLHLKARINHVHSTTGLPANWTRWSLNCSTAERWDPPHGMGERPCSNVGGMVWRKGREIKIFHRHENGTPSDMMAFLLELKYSHSFGRPFFNEDMFYINLCKIYRVANG